MTAPEVGTEPRTAGARGTVAPVEGSRAPGGRPPLPLEEARRLAGGPELAAEAATLAADRAEALAQLQAAQATLGQGMSPSPPHAAAAPVEQGVDPDALRLAAREALAAAHEAERAEEGLAGLPAGDPDALRAAEEAVADAEAARGEVSPARHRAVGAIISGTGMAIVVAVLAWPPWWYVVPVTLVGVLAADLRMAGSAARDASVRAAEQLAAVGVAGPEGLEPARARQREWEAAARRVEAACRRRDEAQARWAELAPGADPGDVEGLVDRLTAGAAAVNTAAGVSEAVRALAAKLAEEARRDLARAEQALADLTAALELGPMTPAEVPAVVVARIEHARWSLEWHEARGALEAGD